jgi:nitrite reductase/ring-hydroxylating ferredoxin subunit
MAPLWGLVISLLAGFPGATQAAEPGQLVAWGPDPRLVNLVPKNLTNIVNVTAGFSHVAVLNDQGQVLVWSISFLADLTVPPNLGRVHALSSAAHHTLALLDSGRVVSWGAWSYVPPNLENVVRIAAGQVFSLALKSDGQVVAWPGDPTAVFANHLVVQVPESATNVVAIDGGAYHAVALRRDGTVVAWGDNDYHQLEIPGDLTNAVAISAGTTHTAALRADGTVTCWGGGDDLEGKTRTPVGLSNVVEVIASNYNTVARTSDGRLVAWGISHEAIEAAPIDPRDIVQMAGRGSVHVALVAKVEPVNAPTAIQFNPSTGLLEQTIVLRNVGSTLLPGMRVLIEGLPEDVSVYNAGGTTDGLPYVEYRSPITNNALVTLRVEFYRATRQVFATPQYVAAPLGAPAPTVSGEPLEVNRRIQIAPGMVLIEFPSQPGARYVVEYTDNLGTWLQAIPTIVAPGTRVQWFDTGPPKTHSIPWGPIAPTNSFPGWTNPPSPLPATNRFYRVLRMAD